ncbi:HAD family acid phosphatase [Catenovulum sediminis]|uniref:HAD family acid phosphatase n=1 Tax=Catenovulum sediminis TaxID=1740262 RepID=UPI00117C25E9|nr:HAD family acid phosphatase [Catenovulum sediminis]
MRKLAILLISTCLPFFSSANETASAVAWMQTSAEYQAIASQTFKTAAEQLQKAVFDDEWVAAIEQFGQKGINQLPNAIILDLDDTLISTLAYRGELIQDNDQHNEKLFKRWMNLEKAPLVPHVLTLIEKASSLGVTVLLISDRICQPNPRDPCPVKSQTLRMLKRVSIGFPKDHMFFRGEYSDWNKDQSSRRSFIAQRYRILMIIGDDANQMIPKISASPPNTRKKLAAQYNEMWGTRWFLLPNPAYGSWRDVLPNNLNNAIQGY